MNVIRRQPVAIVAAIEALLALLLAFGLNLTAEQVGAIIALLTALLAVPVWQAVTPVAEPALEHDVPDDVRA
jgi:hypothetical protein